MKAPEQCQKEKEHVTRFELWWHNGKWKSRERPLISSLHIYLLGTSVYTGDWRSKWEKTVLSMPDRSSQRQPASLPPNIHSHFVLGKELDHICQPSPQESHMASSFPWGVAGAGKRRPPAGYRQTLGGCRRKIARAWVPASLHGTEVSLARRTHLGCFVNKKYSFGGLSDYAFGELFVLQPILYNQ